MQIDGLIQALREDIVRVAAVGDESTSRAANLLSVAIEASLGRRIQDVRAQAALELNDQLESAHVEVRIAGHDLQLVLVREDGTTPEPVDEAYSARITPRLPESLKQRVESSAAREGASVNTWLVQALQRAGEPHRSLSVGGRNRPTRPGRPREEGTCSPTTTFRTAPHASSAPTGVRSLVPARSSSASSARCTAGRSEDARTHLPDPPSAL